MIIRMEDSFIQLANKLNKPFLEKDKDTLARTIEQSYNKIFSIISNLEKSKESKPTVIELGNINGRYFALNLYYYQDEMDDHAIVVDFEKYPDEAQPLIYHKMLELRKRA